MLSAVALLSGCFSLGRYDLVSSGPTASPEEAIRNAEEYLATRPNWNIDCSHFVLACYHSKDLEAFLNRRKYGHNLVYDLNYFLTQKKTRRAKAVDIRPGDVLVFSKTYDINRDGHIDDKDVFTHAGIVETFDNMKVVYIDASQGRAQPILRRRMFSFYPKSRAENGRVAVDPATKREILHKETFYAAYSMPQ